MSKVLVTGGAGFLGSHLVRALEQKEMDVVVLDDLSTGFMENLSGTGAKFIRGTVENADIVRKSADGCDVIFHLAALVSVPMSQKYPEKCLSINVGGTKNILASAEKLGIRKIVFISSASVYGSQPNLPQRESDAVIPESPYAETKLLSEKLCSEWSERTGGNAISIRLFNGFGPRQRADSQYGAVIPRFLAAAMNGKNIEIFGDGEQTRDFIFINDIVSALMFLMEKDFSGIVNLARGEKISINQLAELVQKIAGRRIPMEFKKSRSGEVRHSIADISKIKSLGFEPEISLQKGLEITLNAIQNGKKR